MVQGRIDHNRMEVADAIGKTGGKLKWQQT